MLNADNAGGVQPRPASKLAMIARDLAQKRSKPSRRSTTWASTTMFFVLDAQNAPDRRRSRTWSTESVNYRRNLLNLLRATGELLESGSSIR